MNIPNNPYKMRGYVVAPRSIEAIRLIANNVRQVLKLPPTPVHLEKLLEGLSCFGITVDVVDDSDAPFALAGVEAVCVPETATIVLSTDTYRAACRNDPRTRFTIFHELGHFVLQHSKALGRGNINPKPYLDSEWQADQFAAEITMPLDIIRQMRLSSASAISGFCGTSHQAGSMRYSQLTKKGLI